MTQGNKSERLVVEIGARRWAGNTMLGTIDDRQQRGREGLSRRHGEGREIPPRSNSQVMNTRLCDFVDVPP